jgi:SAM-dependent methyltransferase
VVEERLKPLLERLEQERLEADRVYNEALTAVDRALQTTLPELPDAPAAYDDSQLERANRAWDVLPGGPPAVDGSLKGRLRGLVWRMLGPSIERQREFNAAVIDHLNRNVEAHRSAQTAVALTAEAVRRHTAATTAFEQAVILYLQTITGYVDTKNRATSAALNAGLSALSEDWLKRRESLDARERRLLARVESLDDIRATAALAQQTAAALKREVGKLLLVGTPGTPEGQATPGASAAPAAAPHLEAIKYIGFEDAFRGSEEAIRSRLAEYVPMFEGRLDVLDIGCGRGEFLDLLRERGIGARGLDLNHEMVEACRARGHEVVEGDALSYLASLPDASLGGLFAAQVVEHLEPAYLSRLLDTARVKLRPEAVMVLETINPACWVAFFESYIRDLTHVRPLHPETLQYLARASGFHAVTVEFKSPVPEPARLQRAPPPADPGVGMVDMVEIFNENFAKLNARLFTYMDYAIVART